jgi:hypothetical protein
VVEERAEGATKVLVLRGRPVLNPEERAHTKNATLEFTIRRGPDDVPVAIESSAEMTAGLLFLTVTTRTRERWELVRVGDRLVATLYESEIRGGGLGQSFARTVRLRTRF